jgi:hypothetical protein
MNVTRDIITDLLPLYFSGEASADTRTLVESFFREHPDFEKLARHSVRVQIPSEPGVESAAEKEVLHRVKRILRLRSLLMGLGIFFALTPFTVAWESGHGVRFFMLRDQPGIAMVSLVLAAVFWGLYGWTFRALRETR